MIYVERGPMQVVIFAGGLGTRISEDNVRIPKPLIEIGGIPIIVHLMNYFASFGHKDFLILLGYKSFEIKKYFSEYSMRKGDFTIDLKTNVIQNLKHEDKLDWNVSFVDTGLTTMTGGRLLKAKEHLEKEFFLTYGDGLSDVDLNQLLDFHRVKRRIGTVTAVNPPSRYGALEIEGDIVRSFTEKPNSSSWINGGFFLFDRKVCNYIENEETVLEKSPLETLAKSENLAAFQHSGFWIGMDTPRDKETLENIWQTGNAPWTVARNSIG